MRTIEQHAQALADGSTTSRALVDQCLDRIADPNGEGARAYIKVHSEQARAMADAKAIVDKYPGCTVHGPHFHAARPAGKSRPRKRPGT